MKKVIIFKKIIHYQVNNFNLLYFRRLSLNSLDFQREFRDNISKTIIKIINEYVFLHPAEELSAEEHHLPLLVQHQK